MEILELVVRGNGAINLSGDMDDRFAAQMGDREHALWIVIRDNRPLRH
jgi:hypothetical protein